MTGSPTYIVAGSRPWNRKVFDRSISTLPGQWTFVANPEELSAEHVHALAPRYLFFLHWSWKVPDEIVSRHECVGFHMTDLPFGRGGSPLQNLILLGHRETRLAALQLVSELDAGPIYQKVPMSLEGTAEQVLIRSSELAAEMIRDIIETEPTPVPQEGEPTTFKRRRPAESEIPRVEALGELHDFIRMLDAEGYPRAFLRHNGFRYEFKRAALYDGRLVADVTIFPDEEVR